MSSTSDRHPLLPNHNTAYYHTAHTQDDPFGREHSFSTRHIPFSWPACLQHTFSWLLYLLALAAFTASLVLSLTHIHTSAQHPLPVTLGMIGGAGLVWLLAVPWLQYVEEQASPAWESTCCCLAWLTRLTCFVALLTAAILQSVWAFGADEEEVARDKTLYAFAWWFVVTWWAVLGASVLASCCLCLVCCRAFFLS